MKIAIIGTGYVGLVTGTCLSDFGLEVICVNKDNKTNLKIKSLFRRMDRILLSI